MARESRELARMNREDDNHIHPRDSLAMLFLFVPFCGYCKSLRQTKNLTVSNLAQPLAATKTKKEKPRMNTDKR